MKNLLITGANGFIGSNVCEFFKDKFNITAVSRTRVKNCNWIKFKEDNFKKLKDDIIASKPDFIIHCAAVTHKNYQIKSFFSDSYYKINVVFTKLLIDISIECKSKKFIYMSSIGVHALTNKKPINEETVVLSKTNYAFYKLECEKLIRKNFEGKDVSWFILRPPIIYGPNAPGNLRLLVRAIDLRLPLLLQKNNFKRSLLSINNLLTCMEKIIFSNKNNRIYVIADDQVITFRKLIYLISKARNKSSFLIILPDYLYRLLEKIPYIGKKFEILSNKKCYIVDNYFVKKDLNWDPKFILEDEIYKSFQI